MKLLCSLLCLLLLSSTGFASGWTDYQRDIGDDYTIFRANSMDVCIGRTGGATILFPRDYPGVGPVEGFQMLPDHILAKTAGRTAAGDYDGTSRWFFIIPKSTDEPVGPLSAAQFSTELKSRGITSGSWVRPSNPNFFRPLLGGLMFLGMALLILAEKYYYIVLPALAVALLCGVWLFRRLFPAVGSAKPGQP
jgi:hypothetical protein